VVVALETDRGLWVQALVAAGYVVYAINPLAVSRYRDRHHVGGSKSDKADAKVLADLVRTDRHNHRLIAADTVEVEAIKVLARAHQSLIWARTRHTNTLRSALREYYPTALEAFSDLHDRDALAVLERAPTPTIGARLSISQISAALRRGGRQRNVERIATTVREALREPHLHAPAALAEAFAATTTATVAIVRELNRQIAHLEQTLNENFEQHPDAAIYLSLPGIGSVLGARMLGEFGDDPNRYADAKSRKNYAGTSPLTIASGLKHTVTARWIRNRRLADAITQWAFCSLTKSDGCRTFYDQRRAAGDTHQQALRALGNRLVGILHGCLRHHTPYNEHTAWAHRTPTQQHAA
jgi:transposase